MPKRPPPPSSLPDRIRDAAGAAPPTLPPDQEARYLFALDLATDGDWILDFAREPGLGTALLASRAGSAGYVVGLCPSRAAQSLCRSTVALPNVEFRTGDVGKSAFEGGKFDLVCAFGILGNARDPGRFLAGLSRALKPDGSLLLSVPDRIIPGMRPQDTREGCSLMELDRLLRPAFPFVRYWGQRIRARNRFSIALGRSWCRRLLRFPDFNGIPTDPALFRRMESPRHWQCDHFLALCRKSGAPQPFPGA